MFGLLWSLADSVAQETDPTPMGRQVSPPYYVFGADIQPDIVTQNVGAIGFQPFVDVLAWETFIALNWPVPDSLAVRGVPDRQNIIGGSFTMTEGGPRTMPTGPTVWETFKDADEIFLNPPVKPQPFDAAETIPAPCRQLALANPIAAKRTLVMTSKFSTVVQSTKQAFTDEPLVDQNGQNVWYEVKVNRAYFDFVVNNGYYDSRKQKKPIVFPSGSNTTATDPPVKVKAAWKVMGLLGSRQPDDPSKFYTTEALVFDPEKNTCAKQLLGLVGLHVVQKSVRLPQWMWATFEHVDNAPDMTGANPGPVPGMKYNFFSAQCAGCPLNKPPSKTNPTFPTQVARVTPVNSVAATATAKYRAALLGLRKDNVFANYMLVDAQWAGTRADIGTPEQPKFLANTTMETYLQNPDAEFPPGCINCHGQFAESTDLDFQLTKAYPR